MGAVAHNRTPVKSERTALVCWGPKGEMKGKGALYRGSQAGKCLMTHNNIILLHPTLFPEKHLSSLKRLLTTPKYEAFQERGSALFLLYQTLEICCTLPFINPIH